MRVALFANGGLDLRNMSLRLLILALVALQSCTNLNVKTAEDRELDAPKDIDIGEVDLDGDQPLLPPIEDSTEIAEFKDYNKNVELWIRYFTGRGRHHMERYLSRSGRYIQRMQSILKEEGLPEDLVFLALIESGFNHEAVSHAQAVGYWQFIRGTGKRYGLEISAGIDERRDPVLATQAAARYLRDLYDMFGNWHLAMAAYNAGENRILRAVKRHKESDFWKLISIRRSLPRETQQYVPKFLAARLIAKNPKYYTFGSVEMEEPLQFATVKVDHFVDLEKFAESLNLPFEKIKRYNPRYRHKVAPPRGGFLELRVPLVISSEQAMQAAVSSKSDPVTYIDSSVYRVRPGDTLSQISRRYRVSMSKIMSANGLRRGSILRVGQRLTIPGHSFDLRAEASANRGEKRNSRASSANTTSVRSREVHIVRRGENLSLIARKYRLKVGDLMEWNGVSSRQVLRVGQRLKLRAPEDTDSSSSAQQSESGESSRVPAQSQRDFLRAAQPKSSEENLRVHIVRRGETLTSIAARHRVEIDEIIEANNLRNRQRILVGTQLRIP